MHNPRELQALAAIRDEMLSLPGHLGFYYKNLVTGFTFGVHEEESFGAASVMKLPLFLHILKKAAAGEMRLNEVLTVTAQDKVPICGALTLFTQDIACDIETLCRLMISISDNTATNVLIDRCTIPALQKGLQEMGLEKTQINRKLFDRAASRAGIQNYISPREIGDLLEKLYKNEFVSEEVCRHAIDVLLRQQVDHKINGRISGEVDIAHKTGEDDHLSNDVGIVYAPHPFVICFAGHDTDVYRWEDLMRRASWDLLRAQDEFRR